MPDRPVDRVFSEEEIGRVLKRAAEMQGRQPRVSRTGLTLLELRELASESGIDPDLVDSAIRELEVTRDVEKTNWWGGPMSATLLRHVDGRLPDEAWETLLGELRRYFKMTGTTEQRGSTRQWSIGGQNEAQTGAHLIATYRNGRTELELFWNEPVLAVPIFVVPLVLSLISLPIIFEALQLTGLPAFLVWLAMASTFFGAARTGTSMISRSRKRKLTAFADRLERIASEASTPSRRETAVPEPERERATERAAGPYLQLPDEDRESDSGSDSGRERTGRRVR